MNIKIYDLKCSSYDVNNENYAGGKTKQQFINMLIVQGEYELWYADRNSLKGTINVISSDSPFKKSGMSNS